MSLSDWRHLLLITGQCMCHTRIYKRREKEHSVEYKFIDLLVLIQALQSALELLCLLGAVEKDEKLQARCGLGSCGCTLL